MQRADQLNGQPFVCIRRPGGRNPVYVNAICVRPERAFRAAIAKYRLRGRRITLRKSPWQAGTGSHSPLMCLQTVCRRLWLRAGGESLCAKVLQQTVSHFPLICSTTIFNPSSKLCGTNPSSFSAFSITKPVFAGRCAGCRKLDASTFSKYFLSSSR